MIFLLQGFFRLCRCFAGVFYNILVRAKKERGDGGVIKKVIYALSVEIHDNKSMVGSNGRVKIRIVSDFGTRFEISYFSGHKLRYPVLLDELREPIIMVSNDTK